MPSSSDKNFVNLDNTTGRPEAYREVLERIIKDGVCPFCPENLKKYHTKPILREGKWWTLTENMNPYPGAKEHLLMIHRTHIEDISQISPEAWSELLELARSESKKRSIRGGSLYIRFGGTDYTGASVTHLHANLISPDVENPNRKPLMVRLG